MNFSLILLIAVVAAAAASWTAVLWAQRRTESKASGLRQEVQNLLATQSQAFAAQLGQMSQTVTQQLGSMSQQIQGGMASTGSLVSEA